MLSTVLRLLSYHSFGRQFAVFKLPLRTAANLDMFNNQLGESDELRNLFVSEKFYFFKRSSYLNTASAKKL